MSPPHSTLVASLEALFRTIAPFKGGNLCRVWRKYKYLVRSISVRSSTLYSNFYFLFYLFLFAVILTKTINQKFISWAFCLVQETKARISHESLRNIPSIWSCIH